MKTKRVPLAAALALLFSAIILVLLVSAAIIQMPRYVVNSGGGYISNNGVSIYSSIGQPVSGVAANGITVCSGHLCGQVAVPVTDKVYMPIAVSQYGTDS